MTARILTITASSLAVLFSSCHPVKETPRNPVPKQKTAEEIAKEKEEAERKKAEELVKEKEKQEQEKLLDPTPETPDGSNGTTTTTSGNSSGSTSSGDYPFANKVPGKDGFVFSPYNNKVVDVRDIPSGTLVADPTYPAAEKKYFRVP